MRELSTEYYGSLANVFANFLKLNMSFLGKKGLVCQRGKGRQANTVVRVGELCKDGCMDFRCTRGRYFLKKHLFP